MANEEKKPWYKRPLVLVSIGAGFITLTAGGIILYKKLKGSGDENTRIGKSNGEEGFDHATGKQAPELPSPSYSPPITSTTSPFPLKRGSRNEMVKNLQLAIIKKYGASALPKYGADGDWGGETQTFIDAHPEIKSVIDNTTYTDYITGNFGSQSSTQAPPKTTASNSFVTDLIKSVIPTSITNPYIKVGWQLFDAAKAKNLQATIALLQKLNNVNDYSSASQGFQLRPYELPLRRYTLVTGLFDAFKSSTDSKSKIREQLKRMGLKETVKNSDPANYDSTWALSGIGSIYRNIRTMMKAIITDGFNIRVEIPKKTLIGQWLSSGNGYTRFRTFDGRTMYVRSNAIVLE